jgi:hypothetical protein
MESLMIKHKLKTSKNEIANLDFYEDDGEDFEKQTKETLLKMLKDNKLSFIKDSEKEKIRKLEMEIPETFFKNIEEIIRNLIDKHVGKLIIEEKKPKLFMEKMNINGEYENCFNYGKEGCLTFEEMINGLLKIGKNFLKDSE